MNAAEAGAISFIQVAAATPQTAEASVAVSYANAETAGDLNIVVVGWNDTASTIKSVTDSTGNVYHLAIGPTSGSGLRQSIYYASNILSGTDKVTVSFSQAAAYADVRILEYRGVTKLDVTAGASGNSVTANSGSATTTSASELIFAANTVATGNQAPGSGFTARIITSPDSDLAEDKIVSATGANSAQATLTSGGPWIMQMATFSNGSSGSATPSVLSGLTCSSSSVTGSASDSCTVTLSGPASSGGQSVSLASSGAAVSVPATVTVPANATSATFTANVSSVTSAQTVKLTASAGSVSESFSLQLKAATSSSSSLNGLTCSTASITGAGTDSCTVTLSGAAASGGQSVTLASSNAAVSVPGTVTIAANATSSTFTANVSAVASAQAVTLTASAGGVSKTFALQLNTGSATLVVGNTSLAFGSVPVATVSTRTLSLSSTGTSAVTVNAATLAGTGFKVTGGTFPKTLNAGQVLTLTVQFDPAAAGAETGTLTIQSNSSTRGTAVVSLSGTGTGAGTSASAQVSLNWDAPGSSPVAVTGYNVYRAPGGSTTFQKLNSSVTTGTTYVDTTVQTGVAYDYMVESVDSAGVQSAPSATVPVTVP
ncbi:hypothetical protein HNQ77_000836 [Silvibacterium bohemicum]|uniref:Fibronectin type-III domain-containing protein n=1 Tax=Silvibacterium bohemicum TaxID=1577686 RepID=A0A841JNE7_9BACT|nr:choice-of-anchor D domain-containing protein [Silvibacterium bohemicum]MBB6142892.1 hypothetical protein [Silvibacterium bohemicum]